MDTPGQALPPPKAEMLDVGISLTNYSELCAWLEARGRSGAGGYVVVCNVHTLMEAHADAEYASVLNGALVATPDGMPLVWSLRRMGFTRQQRVYGPDLLLAFAAHASRKPELRSFFLGGAPGVAWRLARNLGARFPGFQTAGCICPPFGTITPEQDAAMVEQINASGAQILWVGLGAPRQERWMARHAADVRPVMVGVGAAFDFLGGYKPQAPRWMMRLGLEWMFRLGSEPRRLWRRYLLHNPHFLWHMRGLLLGGGGK